MATSSGSGPDASDATNEEEARRARKRENRRRYAEAHREEVAERLRAWKAAHPEKVKEYRARFRERHLEQVRRENREGERRRAAKKRTADAAAERRRGRARDRYAQDPAGNLEYQRQRRAAQRAADPDGYREAKRARNKRWRDRHREEQNAKRREKHRDNPDAKRESAARYYQTQGERVRERRRAYYQANREAQLEKQRQWRAREKRRRDAGLPPRRLHRTTAAERAANRGAAVEFFERERTPEQIAILKEELRTPDDVIARWERDSERARIASAIAADTDITGPLTASQMRHRERERAARQKQVARELEEARMDQIARAINDRLRTHPRPVRSHNHAPTPHIPDTSGGLSL